MRRLFVVLGLMVASGAGAQEVPIGVAELLEDAGAALERGDAAAALARADAWKGPPHPLIDLVRGHALVRTEQWDAAVKAYRSALAADPDLEPAGRGLMAALARLERFPELTPVLARHAEASRADAQTLGLWLATALNTADLSLAEAVCRHGLLRFPEDVRFRQGLARVLLDTGRPAEAEALLRGLLAATPDDAARWQQLAFARQQRGVSPRPALEAALLLTPDDLALRARFVELLLADALYPAAADHADALAHDPAHRMLAARATALAGQADRAAGYLAQVPAALQTSEFHRLAARVALARQDHAAARAALGALLTEGEADGRVLIQLAQLERQAGALARAEALLRQAVARPDATAGLAVLHLAHLLLSRQRREEAAQLLRTHLAQHPDDPSARRLLAAAGG